MYFFSRNNNQSPRELKKNNIHTHLDKNNFKNTKAMTWLISAKDNVNIFKNILQDLDFSAYVNSAQQNEDKQSIGLILIATYSEEHIDCAMKHGKNSFSTEEMETLQLFQQNMPKF